MPKFDAAAGAALMDELTKIAAHAGKTILGLASTEKKDIRIKADGSPVTTADQAAETIISEGLQLVAPGVPVISEEQASRERPKAVEHGSYFLVDPLDGTREFIAGRNEYTINIALMTDGMPMLGVICAPALSELWLGIVGKGAEKISSNTANPTRIQTRSKPQGETVIIASRSHLDEDTRAYADRFPHAKLVPSGSSIKFCRIAEGSADLYPRLAPTRDWDVAAGHAILKAAGGDVRAPDGSQLRYGTAALLIPAFVASGAPVRA